MINGGLDVEFLDAVEENKEWSVAQDVRPVESVASSKVSDWVRLVSSDIQVVLDGGYMVSGEDERRIRWRKIWADVGQSICSVCLRIF
jgi:hypothetical protein